MTKWEINELEKIGKAEELKLFPLNKDGEFFSSVIIWIVRVDQELFVRSYKGAKGSWYQHVQLNHKGRISASGITKDVNFIRIDKEDKTLNDKIDQEYRLKYQKYGKAYVDPMISSQAQATTIRLEPI